MWCAGRRIAAIGWLAVVISAAPLAAQRGGRATQDPDPEVAVAGHTYTQAALFQRNIGGSDDQTKQFSPHKIIGNLYANPFIDPAGYTTGLDIGEAMFRAVLAAQQKAGGI